ncbi:hypothetical protein SNE35_09365 [Paucibacter sp. R3-3]|uniref:Uncharacterized protein n=1 Tax=Roseateles agri TaxID=3098619 RepID=A0ABU5DEM2_9BURK|nr:hypothetical protein [Paucibacter sp. R3-3]MDY0744716.1 hypothetical protein [Paucibacter sp. R3-3]
MSTASLPWREVKAGVAAGLVSVLIAATLMLSNSSSTGAVTQTVLLYSIPVLMFSALALLALRSPGLYTGLTWGLAVATVLEVWGETHRAGNSMPGAGFLFMLFPMSLVIGFAITMVYALTDLGSRRALVNSAVGFVGIAGFWLYPLVRNITGS